MELPNEKRGDDGKSFRYSGRLLSVKAYIKELKIIESHYVRGRSTVQYLSSDKHLKNPYAL